MKDIGKWIENRGVEPKMSKGQTFDVEYGNGYVEKYTCGQYNHCWNFFRKDLDIIRYRIHPMLTEGELV